MSELLSENFQFLVMKFSVYLKRLVFVMDAWRRKLVWGFAIRICAKDLFVRQRPTYTHKKQELCSSTSIKQ